MLPCPIDPSVEWTVILHGGALPLEAVTLAEVRLAGRILLEARRAGVVVAYVQSDAVRLIARTQIAEMAVTT